MKALKISAVFFFLIFLWSGCFVWAETVGDVNNDGQVGLEEAVYALQVTSGMKTPSSMEAQAYDMAEYLSQTDWKYYYSQREYDSGIVQKGFGIESYTNVTVNEQNVLALTTETGMYAGDICYYIVDEFGVKYLGYQYSDGGSPIYEWFDPPVVLGLRNQEVGHRITNMYTYSYGIRYQEYVILGTEDITVPAGTFKDCLKVLCQRSRSGICHISYKAKGFGTVKSMRADVSGNGYIWELVNVKDADGNYLAEGTFCSIQGNWNANGMVPASGGVAMVYSSGGFPIYSSLTLMDFPEYPGMFYLKSSDGINFSPDPEAYRSESEIPDISLTITNKQVSGTYNYSGYQGTYAISLNGTLVCE